MDTRSEAKVDAMRDIANLPDLAHETKLFSWRGIERGHSDLSVWEDGDHDFGIMDYLHSRSIVVSYKSAVALRDWLNGFIERNGLECGSDGVTTGGE